MVLETCWEPKAPGRGSRGVELWPREARSSVFLPTPETTCTPSSPAFSKPSDSSSVSPMKSDRVRFRGVDRDGIGARLAATSFTSSLARAGVGGGFLITAALRRRPRLFFTEATTCSEDAFSAVSASCSFCSLRLSESLYSQSSSSRGET